MTTHEHGAGDPTPLDSFDPFDDEALTWNRTRYEPAKVDPTRGHLESTFIKLNDPHSPRALWVRMTVFAPTTRTSGGPPFERGRTVAEAWAIAFDHARETTPSGTYRERASEPPPKPRHVAVKQTTPIELARLAYSPPYRLDLAGVRFDGRRLRGKVIHGNSTISFDLTLTRKDKNPLVHLPHPSLYRSAFPKTKLVSPIVDALADGEIEIDSPNGRRSWVVKHWPAMQGHNWGVGHADTYAWAHVNAWHEPEGHDVVLEGFSARVRAGLVSTPLVTVVAVRVNGVRYEARALPDLFRARGSLRGLRRWEFFARNAGATIEGSVSMRDDDIVGLYYPNPDGVMTYCLNSKLARATLRLETHDRAPLLLTSDAAALEIGTHDASHGARMYV